MGKCKMKPIYFPFTYVSEPVAQALSACFGPFIVYQPLHSRLPEKMQPLVDRGLIDIRVPVTGDEELLERAVDNYRTWAQQQLEASGGAKNAFFKSGLDRRPLFDSSASSQIVAEIKARQRKKTDSADRQVVLSARMFLYFAQQFDLQNRGVDGVLQDYRQKEQKLMRQLQPEEGTALKGLSPGSSPASDDFADYMLETRMEAWTRLLLSDPHDGVLFITHSRSVLDHVLEYTPQAEEVLHVTGTGLAAENVVADPITADRRMAYFAQIVEDRTAPFRQGDIPAGLTLRIYRVSDQTPGDLFARCAGIKDRQRDAANQKNGVGNTLVAVLDTIFAQ